MIAFLPRFSRCEASSSCARSLREILKLDVVDFTGIV